jgi:hypothetical protein
VARVDSAPRYGGRIRKSQGRSKGDQKSTTFASAHGPKLSVIHVQELEESHEGKHLQSILEQRAREKVREHILPQWIQRW